MSFGYRSDKPNILEADLRSQHLPLDVTGTSTNPFGAVYEIEGAIRTPSGSVVRFCSVLSGRSTLEPTCPGSLRCTRGRSCPSTCTAM